MKALKFLPSPYVIALTLLLAAGKASADTTGRDLYVDSTNPGQGSSVPEQSVVYVGPSYTLGGSNAFDDAYVGYNGGGAITQADGTLTVNDSLYLGFNASAAGTYTISGGTLSAHYIVVSDYGQGAFTQTGGTVTTNRGGFSVGDYPGSVGTYRLSGGSLASARAFIGGFGSGIVTQDGGSFACESFQVIAYPATPASLASYHLSNTASLSTTSATIGSLGSASFTQDGGRFTTNGGTISIGSGSVNGTVNYVLSGGILLTGTTNVGNTGSGDTFTQSGGLHQTNDVQFADGASTYSLDGGLLSTAKVFGYKTVTTYERTYTVFPVTKIVPGAGTFNFNGGTLQANGGTPPPDPSDQTGLLTGIAQANVRDGGAIIDTQNFDVAANQILSHSAITGDAAVDGGLTKLGSGRLTLGAADTYNGDTTINAGTLAVSVNGGLGKGNTTVAVGATLVVGSGVIAAHNDSPGTTLTLVDGTTSLVNLAGRGVQDTVAALVINGVAQPAGTYGAPGSGATHTDVANFQGTGQLWVAPNGAPHPHFFDGETALSSGVYYLPFAGGQPFGYYSFLSDPRYLYHFDLGYEYWFDANDGRAGIYFYDFQSSDFFYTSPSFPFPYLYSFNLQTVLYYYPDLTRDGRYNTDGVRYFYNFKTGQIISD